MAIYHVEIKNKAGKVIRGIVAKTKKEAMRLQRQLQNDPLVPSGGTVTVREEVTSSKAIEDR